MGPGRVAQYKEHDLLQLSQDKPVCPLCESQLPQDRQQFLNTKLGNKAHFLNHRFERVSKFISQSKVLLLKEHQALDITSKEVQKVSQKLNKKRNLRIHIKLLTKKKNEIIAALKIVEETGAALKKEEAALGVQRKHCMKCLCEFRATCGI